MIKLLGVKHRWCTEGPWILDLPYLSIEQGEMVALVGESGIGKSTLLAIIAGWITPSEGEVWVGDAALHLMSRAERARWRREHVGWQSEITSLFTDLTLIENLDVSLWLGLDRSSHHEEKRAHYLRELNLADKLHDRPVQSLSSGERVRVELARLLLSHPSLALCDEPTAHLTRRVRPALLRLIDQRAQLPSQTLVIATHDSEVINRCHRVIDLSNFTDHVIQDHKSTQVSDHRLSADHSTVYGGKLHSRSSLFSVGLWRYLLCRLKASKRLYLLSSIAMIVAASIPAIAHFMASEARQSVMRRADQTPLVIGADSSPISLFFSTLYFTSPPAKQLTADILPQLSSRGEVPLTPILFSGHVQGYPLVGTDSSYYTQRTLKFTSGRPPLQLGEVILSTALAKQLGVCLGSVLSTDLHTSHQLTSPEPIQLTVVGLITVSQTPDDFALFTSLQTGWSVLGYGHTHRKQEGELSSAFILDQRLNPKQHHLHIDPDKLPLTAILSFPSTPKIKSLLKMRWTKDGSVSVIEPHHIAHQTLKALGHIERLFRPLLAVLSLLAMILTLLILGQHHGERTQERHALVALGLTPREAISLCWLEYLVVTLILILTMSILWVTFTRLIDPSWITQLLFTTVM